MNYATESVIESKVMEGVRFRIAKMSFGRRIELARQIRELAQRIEFLNAGDSGAEKMDAALLWSEIDRVYVLWGLKAVEGLELDGCPATPEQLAAAGPEELFREVLTQIKMQCGLTAAERKN